MSLEGIDPNDKASIEWLNSQKKRTRKTYKNCWRKFLEFTGMTGDQILVDRKADNEHKWERKVLDFKQWMMDAPKQRNSLQHQSSYSATGAVMTVRGFFAYHYVPLQYRAQEKKRLGERNRITEDYHFNLEELKRMADCADLEDKYVLVAGKSFGLRAIDFIHLTRGVLEPYINREVPISIGPINTIKENVSAYPFIDGDAQPVIKIILDWMTREGRTNPTDRLLTFQERELTSVLKRLAVKAGIKIGNKRIRFHCLRKFLCDHLASHMSESKWKQIVGKTIDERAYISADSLREDYKRAMETTTFNKMTSHQEIELLAKRQALLIIAKNAGITEDEVKLMFEKVPLNEGVKRLEDAIEKKGFSDRVITSERFEKQIVKDTGKNCSDGEHCQRLVTEQELETLLPQGWHVVTCLPSGKIVVSNE